MSSQDRYQELRRELDAQPLIDAAVAATGLSDFGPDQFREPLEKLLDCVARDSDFHAQGLQIFKGDIVRALSNRLRMQLDLKQHPEILDEDVSNPIIIIGLPRSGTTKLHKMLAAPREVQKPLFWRLWNPARFPDAEPGKPDPRIAAGRASQYIGEPTLDVAHHVDEDMGEVEEELLLYMITFKDWIWAQMSHTPSYFDWIMQQPVIDTFRYVRTILKYLQWQDGGHRGRPWILKSVTHIANFDSLLECYPNATFVHAHRDPRACIPSYAKVQGGIWSIQTPPSDPHHAGAETLRMWRTAMDRYLKARDGLKAQDRVVDVAYDQVRTDPMSIVREVYKSAGRTMSAEAEKKMSDWHKNNEQHQHGKLEYSLEEFGLSETVIDNAFSEYIHRFIKR